MVAFRIDSVVWYRGMGSRPWPCRVVAKSRTSGRWILDVYAQTENALDGLEARMQPLTVAFDDLAGDNWRTEDAPFAQAVRAARHDADAADAIDREEKRPSAAKAVEAVVAVVAGETVDAVQAVVERPAEAEKEAVEALVGVEEEQQEQQEQQERAEDRHPPVHCPTDCKRKKREGGGRGQ